MGLPRALSSARSIESSRSVTPPGGAHVGLPGDECVSALHGMDGPARHGRPCPAWTALSGGCGCPDPGLIAEGSVAVDSGAVDADELNRSPVDALRALDDFGVGPRGTVPVDDTTGDPRR